MRIVSLIFVGLLFIGCTNVSAPKEIEQTQNIPVQEIFKEPTPINGEMPALITENVRDPYELSNVEGFK